jgi:hypothetical protein
MTGRVFIFVIDRHPVVCQSYAVSLFVHSSVRLLTVLKVLFHSRTEPTLNQVNLVKIQKDGNKFHQ